MKIGKTTSRSLSTCTLVMFALAYVATIDIMNKGPGIYALITGEPTNILYYNAGDNKPPPNPDTPDRTDQAACTHRTDQERPYYSSSASCPFVFKQPHLAFRTDAGEFKVVILGEEHLMQRRKMGVGLFTLEPDALLLPQYLNGPSVFYVHRGQANLSYVKDGMEKSKVLTAGEVYAISAGAPFYVLNAQGNENLQMITLVDLSDLPKHGTLQCFYVGGGTYPTTVMSGFTEDVAAAAFKVPAQDIHDLFETQKQGPIINATQLMQSQDLLNPFKSESSSDYTYVFKKKERHYRLLDEKHVFHNQNGWSASMNRKRYKGLEEADVGMFAVGLKSGCMVAPHWNPSTTEIGIVTHGRGFIQVVHSNGSIVVDMDLEPGSIFVVPRYYPSSQIAANDSDFEFVGFTTSSHPMQPHFLAGANSVFQSIDENVLSKAFNVTKGYVRDILGAQPDEIILTTERRNW